MEAWILNEPRTVLYDLSNFVDARVFSRLRGTCSLFSSLKPADTLQRVNLLRADCVEVHENFVGSEKDLKNQCELLFPQFVRVEEVFVTPNFQLYSLRFLDGMLVDSLHCSASKPCCPAIIRHLNPKSLSLTMDELHGPLIECLKSARYVRNITITCLETGWYRFLNDWVQKCQPQVEEFTTVITDYVHDRDIDLMLEDTALQACVKSLVVYFEADPARTPLMKYMNQDVWKRRDPGFPKLTFMNAFTGGYYSVTKPAPTDD